MAVGFCAEIQLCHVKLCSQVDEDYPVAAFFLFGTLYCP